MTTIGQERAGLVRVGRPLISRETAGLVHDYTTARTVTEPATRAFVHITVTNWANYRSDAAHWRAVEAIGRTRFPATGISYNRGHMRSGRAYEGQPIGRRGAHTVNDYRRATCTQSGCPGRGGSLIAPDWNLNYNSRSYVICQNVGDDVPAAMLDSVARSIAADKLAGFVQRDAEIHGHLCVANKACPAPPMWRLMGELAERVEQYVRTGLGRDWDEMATKDEVKAALREVLTERVHVSMWDGVKRSVVQLLNSTHLYAIQGGWRGKNPPGIYNAALAGQPTYASTLLGEVTATNAAVTALTELVEKLVGTPPGDPGPDLEEVRAVLDQALAAHREATLAAIPDLVADAVTVEGDLHVVPREEQPPTV